MCIIWNSNFARYLPTVWEPTNLVQIPLFQELEIKGKKHQKLHWLGYSIMSKYKDGREQLSDLDVTNLNNYPTMVFAPVNSYTTETFQPLIWWEKVFLKREFIHWYITSIQAMRITIKEHLQSALVCQRHGDFEIQSEFCYACTFKVQTIWVFKLNCNN